MCASCTSRTRVWQRLIPASIRCNCGWAWDGSRTLATKRTILCESLWKSVFSVLRFFGFQHMGHREHGENQGKATCRILGDIEGSLEAAAFVGDFFLQLKDGVEQSLGPGRASGNVDVHGNYLVDSLHDGVIVEDAAGSRAGAHGNHPLGLRHLRVKLLYDGRHFLRNAPSDDHQV